jgi:hypothetical protein
MKKQIELEIPTSWADITLKEYLEMQTDMEAYKDDVEAQTAFMMHHLYGLEADELNNLTTESFGLLKSKMDAFADANKYELKRIIKIGDIEYGFEPNLSTMTYGAYVDITKFNNIAIDNNWHKIMAILYRPIERKLGDNYSIKPYTGKYNENLFLNLGMDIHFGTFFFFASLCKDLLISTLNSTKTQELSPNMKLTLEKSGEVMQQLLNLQVETSKK